MLFKSRPIINSEEFEKLSKRLSLLEAQLNSFDAKMESIRSNVSSLRGLVNRKLENIEDEEKKDINMEGVLQTNGLIR